MYCQKCGKQLDYEGQSVCPWCGADASERDAYSYSAPDMPMKWYKFLIYFALWAGMVMNAVYGVQYLTGMIYEGNAEWVYLVYPELQAYDMIYAVALLGLAVFGFITRKKLAEYRADAPQFLKILYIASAAVGLIYIVLLSTVVGGIDMTSAISSLITSVIMVVANHTYFEKRSHLFVN